MAISIGRGVVQKKTVEHLILNSMRTQETFHKRANLYGASAGNCERANFLSAQDDPLDGALGKMSAQSYFYMGIGDGIELAIVDGLTRADRLFGDNVYLPVSDPVVRGKMDIIFLDDAGQICLGEIKSCGKLPVQPKDGHYRQALTYASISGHDNVYVIYVSRNVIESDGSVAIKAFPVDTSKNSLLGNMEIICRSGLAIKNGYIPAIPTWMQKSHCRYCSFYEKYCWGDGASDGNFVRTPVELRDESVIELQSTVDRMYAERQDRYVTHLTDLLDEERVKESKVLKQALLDKIQEVSK